MKHIFFCQGVFKNNLSKFHGGLCPVWYVSINQPGFHDTFQPSSAEKQFDCEVKAQRPSSHACQWHTAALHSWFPTCFDIHNRTFEQFRIRQMKLVSSKLHGAQQYSSIICASLSELESTTTHVQHTTLLIRASGKTCALKYSSCGLVWRWSPST